MRRIWVAVLILVAIAAAIAAWFWYKSGGKWAPAFGGSNLSKRLPDGAHYQQNDPRWSSHSLGNLNRETLAQAGCTVTSVAMAMTNLGFPPTPAN